MQITMLQETEETVPMVNRFEVEMDGLNPELILSISIPELNYSNAEPFQLEVGLIPFKIGANGFMETIKRKAIEHRIDLHEKKLAKAKQQLADMDAKEPVIKAS